MNEDKYSSDIRLKNIKTKKKYYWHYLDFIFCLVDPNRWFPRSLSILSLRKIPKFHLISWCGNCAFKQNFNTRKLGKTTVFYAVCTIVLQKIMVDSENNYLQIKVTILFIVARIKKPLTQNVVKRAC